MYKRPAQLLFYHPDPAVALHAVTRLHAMAEGWAVARPFAPERLAWGDLLILLDPSHFPALPLPPPLRCVTWPLPTEPAAAATELGRRIAGLIGGMKMLARQG